jgi:hypothetical protein
MIPLGSMRPPSRGTPVRKLFWSAQVTPFPMSLALTSEAFKVAQEKLN